VAMSAPFDTPPITQRIENGKAVVMVVVIGARDPRNTKPRPQEERMHQAIESLNPHSKFMVVPNMERSEMTRHWVDHLKYILRWKKEKT
jgi:hypothetical protein